MTQHIPPVKVDRNPTVEAAARLKDVTERVKAARPADQGADRLRRPVDGMDLDYGTPMDSIRDIL